VACRAGREKRELLRIVRSPDRKIRLDDSGRAAGRGAYVCRDTACITTAIHRGALARALETPVPASLLEELVATVTTHSNGGGTVGQE
jgi:uncharacterized protein